LSVGNDERDSSLVLSEVSSILSTIDLIIDILRLLVELLDFSIEKGISLRVVMCLSGDGKKGNGLNSGKFGKHFSYLRTRIMVLTLLTLVKL